MEVRKWQQNNQTFIQNVAVKQQKNIHTDFHKKKKSIFLLRKISDLFTYTKKYAKNPRKYMYKHTHKYLCALLLRSKLHKPKGKTLKWHLKRDL